MIHRDIKPENVIIDSRGQPVIVDFGLAHSADGARQGGGNIEGTLAYMAPEQQDGNGQPSGPACDIYSLGVLLFELLAGQNPFRGTFAEVLEQNAASDTHLYKPWALTRLWLVCASEPYEESRAARFTTMIDFADRLAAYLRDEGAEVPAALPAPPRSGQAVSTVSHPMDPRIADEVLQLLREWGWEVGLARLETRIQVMPDIQRRGLLRLLAGWIKGERGDHAAGIEQFREAEQIPEMRAWARTGQAFIRYRTGQLDEGWKLLDLAEQDATSDVILQATIDHGRGAIRYRQARDDEALEYLYRAAERFGPDHFGFGRVVDTLGMIYVAKENFPAAFSLFQKALTAKEKHQDLLGLALTHGQLGRLLLDWGEPDRAEKEFRADLELCLRTNDSRGEAQMFNHLGQVFLARGQASRALEYLNESVTRCQALGFADGEGYARKDRARALVALGRATEAEEDAREAERLAGDHSEIAFHARRAMALALASQDKWAAAEPMLRQAAAFFRDRKDSAEAARALLELARVQRRRPGASAVVIESLRSALEQADFSRRDVLVSEIERELAEVNQEELFRRAYRRARGAGIPEDIGSLSVTQGEKATILFLDLRNFTGFSLTQDPRIVQMTLNQIFADMAAVVSRHDIIINQYLGDGFMALVRDKDHARRAVAGALEMHSVIAAFNRPRRLLGPEPLLEARIGVATGDVVFGNIGTYRKLDFTAVGPTTNLAARLQTEARPGMVCISEETFHRLQDGFTYEADGGRRATLKGIGDVRVWDVKERASLAR